MAVVITIGRNIKGVPMGTDVWKRLQEEVRASTLSNTGRVYFTGTGIGDSPEWGVEDAYTVVAESPERVDRLYYDLGRLARYYGQEAVAVTEGPTEFV